MQVMKWSVIALAVAAGTTQMAVASSQSESKGFVEDSSLSVLNKNFYFNRDFRNNANDEQSYREEWAHGILANYASGYTQGVVGFGVDAHAALGLKLDSGKGTTGTGLLPRGSDGRAEDDYSYAGGAVKARISNTELKYGDLIPTAPVFATGSARLFPGTATGFQLLSSDIENLSIDAGHFTAIRDGSASTNSDGEITLAYGGAVDAASVDYIGGTYSFTDNFSATVFGAKLEDIWNQYYGNLNYTIPLAEDQALNFDFNIYDTSETGDELAGTIDNTTWSLAAAYSLGAHKFTLAHQQVDGDEPMDYIAMDGFNAGDSIWLNNSVQYSDFNGPNEKSWQARYDLDMTTYGVPGLSFMIRYLTGDDIDGSKYDGGPNGVYGYFGEDGEEWERNIEAKYVFQEGPAKDLSIRLRQSTWRANSVANAALGNDMDEFRIITEYPLDIL